jgi:hypothetical protein
MSLEAIYQTPRTTDPRPAHRIYSHLIKGLAIDRPNQVRCADITCMPAQHGFVELVAIMAPCAGLATIEQHGCRVTGRGLRRHAAVDMMDEASTLPISPQAQQPQQNVINRIQTAQLETGIHLIGAAKLSNKAGPFQWHKSHAQNAGK